MAVLRHEDRKLTGTDRVAGLRLVVEELNILLGIEPAQRFAQDGTFAQPKVSRSPRTST